LLRTVVDSHIILEKAHTAGTSKVNIYSLQSHLIKCNDSNNK